MKARDVLGVLVGLILGVLGACMAKCGGGGGGTVDAGPETSVEAAPAPVDAVAAADAVAADDAAAPTLDGALSAAALAKCPKCPCSFVCKPGQMLPCFGCQQGSQRQMPGTRPCVGNTWGACSAGPDCLGP